MKARYEFENEIIEEYGDSMEPHQQGYNIDDLNAEDRAFVGGVLWALMTVENSRLNYCEGDEKTVLEQMREEVVEAFCDELKADLLCEVRNLAVSSLDGYEVETDED